MKEMTARRDVLMQNLRLETSSRIAKDKVSLSFPLSLCHALSLTRTLSVSLSRARSLSLARSLTHSFALSHTYTRRTHMHTYRLSLSLFHTNTNMCCRKQ